MPEIIKTELEKSDFEKLEALLQENMKSSTVMLQAIKDIKKYIRWQQIWSTLRFFLIVVPIILGFIYLPPLLKDALQQYKDLLLN